MSGKGYPPIEDHGVIGNGRSCALVARDGTIDWLCLPRFDSPSVFGSLLDLERGGAFRVGPSTEAESTRRYVGETNVLETSFRVPGGRFRVVDFMPVADEEVKDAGPWAEHQILRKVECLEGEAEVEVRWDPRPGYGRADPRAEGHGKLGIWCQNSSETYCLLSEIPLEVSDDGRSAEGHERLEEGEVRWVSLTYARGEPAVIPPLGETAEELLRLTIDWWERWISQCRYEGPHPRAVRRSALALKLLIYAPSGAVVAAGTTSLPEVVGGERNWDYRFTWLRDASWTLRALFELGFRDEAEAFYDWIVQATRVDVPRLQPLYDVHGGRELTEEELDHLEGYRGSRPVRAGNGAEGQLQLDVYGEVIGAAYEFVQRGGEFDKGEVSFLASLGRTVCDLWREPDKGIWEIRGHDRHYTYSKVMCWTALDRLVRMAEEGLLRVPTDRYRSEMEAIRAEVEERGWSSRKEAYGGALEEDFMDAAVLRMPIAGYLEAGDERMRKTADAVWRELGCDGGNGMLLYRYTDPGTDDLEGEEGAFAICSFWAVEWRALAGEVDRAEEELERMLEYANDVGLFSEEIDPPSGSHLGNFPQAFTHVGLINAAVTIAACRRGEEAVSEAPPRAAGEGSA